jgi:hypothetical protein
VSRQIRLGLGKLAISRSGLAGGEIEKTGSGSLFQRRQVAELNR